MSNSLAILWVCLLVLGSQVPPKGEGEWTGWLSDAKCAANGTKKSHKGCALKCVESGQAIVFVSESDKRTYNLENTDKVKPFLGDRIRIKGTLEGGTIKIDSAVIQSN